MSDIRLAELDFEAIKQNLKSFLKSQSDLTDYDFEGSTITHILDVLAYNTHYNGMLAHLLANEMFIDTAIKRSSVVSHAKTLGYTPRSARGAVATVSLKVRPTDTPAPLLTLPMTTAFVSLIDELAFTFFPKETYTAPYDAENDWYLFPNVSLIEGVLLQSRHTVTSETVSGPFLLPNPNIDTTTIRVRVAPSSDSVEVTTYSQTDTIVDLLPTSKVFWVEETPSGRYQVLFGNGLVGAPLSVGSVVMCEYFQTSGTSSANGASKFSLGGVIPGGTNIEVSTVYPAAGGAAPEAIDSIRFNAPRLNATRNRAVTAEDYKTIIKALYPFVKGIAVWGGEDNNPPIYGKVFISIDTVEDYVLTETDKQNIINTILKPRSMLTLQHEFVEAENLYVGLDVQVKYNALRTTLDAAQMRTLITAKVRDYFANEVSTLDQTMYYSRLLGEIDSTEGSIIGSQVAMRLHKRFTPIRFRDTAIHTTMNTAIEPGSVKSSRFYTTIGETPFASPVFVQDVPVIKYGEESVEGSLKLIDVTTGQILLDNYGTVNYETGAVNLDSVYVRDYPIGIDAVLLYAVPQDGSYNISPAILNQSGESEIASHPMPSRNLVLRLDKNGLNTSAGVAAGLTVSAHPLLEGK